MNFYLSSSKIGQERQRLREMATKTNQKCAYIPNAKDYTSADEEKETKQQKDIQDLESLGLKVEILDLQKYFKKEEKLREKMQQFGVFWVRGGNVFVLRQAMKLSGFDQIILDLFKNKAPVLYGGYSAGICVLTPNLQPLENLDAPNIFPYSQQKTAIFTGLGLLDFLPIPHF